MTLNPVRASFRADLRKATLSVVARVREKAGPELVDAVLSASQ